MNTWHSGESWKFVKNNRKIKIRKRKIRRGRRNIRRTRWRKDRRTRGWRKK